MKSRYLEARYYPWPVPMTRHWTMTLVALILFLWPCILLAKGAGTSRAAYTRSGWIGARYVAMGMSAEVRADDVYALYWNPAGLSELRGRKTMTIEEIKKKASEGKADQISEDDLLRFSHDEKKRATFHIAMSGGMLDNERNAAFVGTAFELPKGVLGIGFYSLFSVNIDARDEAGRPRSDMHYFGSMANFSYGVSLGVASLGVTLKCLYEGVGDVHYMGVGADVGTQVYVLPFLKIGFVIQDLGTGLYPVDDYSGVAKRYDFAYPTLRLGVMLSTDAGISLSFSVVKKIEQDDYGFCFGVGYDIVRYFSLYLGMNNANFSCGATVEVYYFKLSYAFAIDNIDYGYNHIISLAMLF